MPHIFFKYCLFFLMAIGCELISSPLRALGKINNYYGITYIPTFVIGFAIYFFLMRILIKRYNYTNYFYMAIAIIFGIITLPLILEVIYPLGTMGCWLEFPIRILGVIFGLISMYYSTKKKFIILLVTGFSIAILAALIEYSIWAPFVYSIRHRL